MSLDFSQITEGGLFSDNRGTVAFVNDFDLSPIKRMYVISHPNTDIIRAWRGHKIERKWFFCTKGVFEIKVIEIDNWDNPAKDLLIKSHILNANKTQILAVREGCCTAIRALPGHWAFGGLRP